MSTAKKHIGLVGHCTPDSSHLTMAVTRAIPGAKVTRVTDEAGVRKLLEQGVDLLLVNRAMEPGYAEGDGNVYIRNLVREKVAPRLMLISNYAESQAQAVADGALPGFGKSDLMSETTAARLREALKD
jgi:two-component system, chemotaxis family, chemotaxis protein CheY